MSIETKRNNEFLQKLGDLLEEYEVAVASVKTSCGKYSKVVFQTECCGNLFPAMRRTHVTAHDVRILSGLSGAEATSLYVKHRNKGLMEGLSEQLSQELGMKKGQYTTNLAQELFDKIQKEAYVPH